MTSHSVLFGLVLVIALAVTAQGITLVAGPGDADDASVTTGTYFRLIATPSNCTEPCVIRFEAETDDPELIFFRWNWTNDDSWDTPWLTDTVVYITFRENYDGYACVESQDDAGVSYYACTGYRIMNVPPQATLSTATSNATATLRIAGQKGSGVSVYLEERSNETLVGSLLREPGKPQTLSFPVAVGPGASGSLSIEYTPGDEGNGHANGATPAWLNITLDSGQSFQMQHTFNAKHPETWNWTVDLNLALTGHTIGFTANAVDPGPDDLTFGWDFGDGSPVESMTYYSLGVYPFTATDVRSHTYSTEGNYTVTLKVSDDDGGETILTMAVQIG